VPGFQPPHGHNPQVLPACNKELTLIVPTMTWPSTVWVGSLIVMPIVRSFVCRLLHDCFQDHKQSVNSVLPFCRSEDSRTRIFGYHLSVPELVAKFYHARKSKHRSRDFNTGSLKVVYSIFALVYNRIIENKKTPQN